MNNKSASLKKNTFNGFLWMFTGSGIQLIMQFGVLMILSRILDPETFGIISAALVVISFTVVLSTLGFGPALVQKNTINNKHIGTSYTISIILALFFAALIFLVAPFIASFFQANELTVILRVMSIVFVFQAISTVSESLIQREMMFNVMARIQVISYISYGSIGIILAILGYGVWALVIAYISQMFVKFIMSLYLQPYKFIIGFDYNCFKELLYFSGGYSIAKLSAEVTLQGDNFIVGRFLGTEALGLYSRAYQLMVMPANLINTIFEKVLFPVLSKIQGNNNKLSFVYSESIKVTTTLILPSSIFLFLNAEPIILLLFGEQWTSITVPFKILALALFFRSSHTISDSLVKAKGAVYQRALRKWIYAISVIIGSYIGHPYGIKGIAIGVFIAVFLSYIMMIQLVIKLIGIKLITILKSHFGGLVLALSYFLISILFEKQILVHINNYIIELLMSMIFFGLFFGVNILLHPSFYLGENGKKYIEKIKIKINNYRIKDISE